MTGLLYLSALGIACALGAGKEAVFETLFRGKTHAFQPYLLISQKTVPAAYASFELPPLPATFSTQNSKNNRLLRIALDEIAEVVEAAKKKYGAHRLGIVLGTSTSGMREEERAFAQTYRTGKWSGNYHYALTELASPSVFTADYFSLKGPAYTVSTACSSSGKALCAARRLIEANICDAVITGGVDTLCDLTLNGFDALELLSDTICNPFSKHRAGINIGEGAAVFLMTRDNNTEHGIEFAGGGESSDAHHISSPDPMGEGALTAICAALKMAGLSPEEISYINLHGTGTLLNDAMESASIHRLFGECVPCSSTKALTGHALGAASAIEAAFLWLALSQVENDTAPVPPHIWDGMQDELLPKLHLTSTGDRVSAKNNQLAMMSNSFAFGGSNVSLILKRQLF